MPGGIKLAVRLENRLIIEMTTSGGCDSETDEHKADPVEGIGYPSAPPDLRADSAVAYLVGDDADGLPFREGLVGVDAHALSAYVGGDGGRVAVAVGAILRSGKRILHGDGKEVSFF
jgi:hypothetical protein